MVRNYFKLYFETLIILKVTIKNKTDMVLKTVSNDLKYSHVIKMNNANVQIKSEPYFTISDRLIKRSLKLLNLSIFGVIFL